MAIREYKWSFMLYNFFQKKKLVHNIPLFKKYGIRKKYYSPISSSDFKSVEAQYVRKENPAAIAQTLFFQKTDTREPTKPLAVL